MSLRLFIFVCFATIFCIDCRNINESVFNTICRSFGQVKCPFDNHCVNKRLACYLCPNGSDKYCPFLVSDSYFGRCNLKGRFKYYRLDFDACNAFKDCPANTTDDEDGCNIQSICTKKTVDQRKLKCQNENKCVVDQSECDDCRNKFGGNEHICTEAYCTSLKVTWPNDKIYGKHQFYVKCPESPKCILKGQFCDGVIDCPNQEDERNCTKESCIGYGKIKCPMERKCIDKE